MLLRIKKLSTFYFTKNRAGREQEIVPNLSSIVHWHGLKWFFCVKISQVQKPQIMVILFFRSRIAWYFGCCPRSPPASWRYASLAHNTLWLRVKILVSSMQLEKVKVCFFFVYFFLIRYLYLPSRRCKY